jgi:glycine/D-amino acid oxidase-like deaminating enzyme
MTKLDDGAIRLRSGRSVWLANDAGREHAQKPHTQRVFSADIAIVGAGITGAFLAEKFTRAGRTVVIIDRHAPTRGSTAASTAMLLWELDASLLEVEDRMGIERAGRIAARCRREVQRIGELVNELGISADFRPRPSLYLAGDKLDAADLREEHRIRQQLGIEGIYLDEQGLAARGLVGGAALLYPGSAEADPVKLAHGLLAIAVKRGAVIISPAVATNYEHTLTGVTIATDQGDIISAQTLVLASGYEMPDFVPVARHSLATSWALATGPAEAACMPGPDGALIWEASDPYLYVRMTVDGRVIIGGEDEEFCEADKREAMTSQKIKALLAKAATRCPGLAGVEPQYVWSGVFGETDDSLPMIGRVPGTLRTLAAYGYGGNGITFSALAADLLEAELEGRPDPDAALFALDRS